MHLCPKSARRPRGVASAAAALAVACLVSSAAADRIPDFNRDIRPLLSHNCFACHGPDEHDRRGGLRLDDRDAAVAELESGSRAIVPGHPEESELVARLHQTDPDVVMPPPESNHVLTAEQKQLLAAWIAAGAPYAPHWAYVGPRRHGYRDPDKLHHGVRARDRGLLGHADRGRRPVGGGVHE